MQVMCADTQEKLESCKSAASLTAPFSLQSARGSRPPKEGGVGSPLPQQCYDTRAQHEQFRQSYRMCPEGHCTKQSGGLHCCGTGGWRCHSLGQKYFEGRILRYVYGRVSSLLFWMPAGAADSVNLLDNGLYAVPSPTYSTTYYEVSADVGASA
ncbi:hypothetical protein MTO96_023761 [Rhipicephalus appendiculatus]